MAPNHGMFTDEDPGKGAVLDEGVDLTDITENPDNPASRANWGLPIKSASGDQKTVDKSATKSDDADPDKGKESGQGKEQEPPKKFAGKYDTVEDFEKGYKSADEHIRKIESENKEYRLKQLEMDKKFEALEIRLTEAPKDAPASDPQGQRQRLFKIPGVKASYDSIAAVSGEDAANASLDMMAAMIGENTKSAEKKLEEFDNFRRTSEADGKLNSFKTAHPELSDEKLNKQFETSLREIAEKADDLDFIMDMALAKGKIALFDDVLEAAVRLKLQNLTKEERNKKLVTYLTGGGGTKPKQPTSEDKDRQFNKDWGQDENLPIRR